MLNDSRLVAFIGVRDADRARAFYRDTLNLTLLHEDSFALVFDAAGTMLRVTIVHEVEPRPYTVLGWQVDDVSAMTQTLAGAGVTMERYPHFEQDANGIWTAPSGARIAWFKDADGNLLSITQM